MHQLNILFVQGYTFGKTQAISIEEQMCSTATTTHITRLHQRVNNTFVVGWIRWVSLRHIHGSLV